MFCCIKNILSHCIIGIRSKIDGTLQPCNLDDPGGLDVVVCPGKGDAVFN